MLSDILKRQRIKSSLDDRNQFSGKICIFQFFCFSVFLKLYIFHSSNFTKSLYQFFFFHRLQYIIRTCILDCLLGILKISISAQNNEINILEFFRLAQSAQKFQTVHDWHFDICKNKICVMILQKVKCLFSVRS